MANGTITPPAGFVLEDQAPTQAQQTPNSQSSPVGNNSNTITPPAGFVLETPHDQTQPTQQQAPSEPSMLATAASDLYGMGQGVVQMAATPAMHIADAVQHVRNGDYSKAIGSVLQSMASDPADTIADQQLQSSKLAATRMIEAAKKGDALAVAQHFAGIVPGASQVDAAMTNYQNNPSRANLIHVITSAAPILVPGGIKAGSDIIAPVGESAASEAAMATKPSLVQQIIKGKNAVEPQGQETLRAGVKAGGENSGLSTVQGQSLRDVMEEPIEKLHAQASESYKALDEAAGTDIKALRNGLKNDQYNRTLLGNTPEDIAKAEKLDASIKDTQQKIADAEARVAAKGIDPKIADTQFTKAKAAEEFRDKIFHNQSVIKGDVDAGQPETVNVDAAVRESQKLMDKDKFGDSRLEQFMGKDGAAQYMSELRQLQQQGVHAMKVQAIAKLVGKYVLLPAVGAGVYETAHELSK